MRIQRFLTSRQAVLANIDCRTGAMRSIEWNDVSATLYLSYSCSSVQVLVPQLHFDQTKVRKNIATNSIAALVSTACAGGRPSIHVYRRVPNRFRLEPIRALLTACYSHLHNLLHDIGVFAHKRQRPIHRRRGRFYASTESVDERRK